MFFSIHTTISGQHYCSNLSFSSCVLCSAIVTDSFTQKRTEPISTSMSASSTCGGLS